MRRLLLSLALALPLVAATATPAHAIARSCAWTVQITGDQVNALFPDEAAKYWVALVPVVPGGKVVLKGQYPYARYTSLNTYTTQTQAIDAIHDTEIAPDPGSFNPYVRNADRRRTPRSYTVTVVMGQKPKGDRPQNTLYTVNEDGSRRGNTAAIALRIYRPDQGRDIDGGVPLPSVSVHAPDGRKLYDYPTCPDTSIPDLGLTPALANAGAGVGLPGPGLFARNPPLWHKYVNTQTAVSDLLLDNQITGPLLRNPVADLATKLFGPGGFGENVDNKYVYTSMSREFGAVLVLRGKLPTFPRTYERQRRMGGGQLRYWSLCTENQLTQYYACRTDDQIPIDRDRMFTVMVSTAANRPANARRECGVQWLPAGPLPQTILLLRNMLPSRGFTQAIQRVDVGKEAQQMGPYLPRGTYYPTPLAAERAVGCPARPARSTR